MKEDELARAEDARGSVGETPAASCPTWTQQQAIDLCRKIEAVCPPFGCHVALTGGALYKDGPRKDADILFYRIRQVEHIDVDGLFGALAEIGVTRGPDHGWCQKATYEGRAIDFFFPEREGLEYPRADRDDMPMTDLELGKLSAAFENARPFDEQQ